MLFWELTQGNGSLPFANVPDTLIADHIFIGKVSETLNSAPIFSKINVIIQGAWKRRPELRPTADAISQYLDNSAVHQIQPNIYNDNVLSKSVNIDDLLSESTDQMNPQDREKESMQKGLEYHRSGEYELAFEVFMDHAVPPEESPEAQYYVGYHYYYGKRGKPNFPEALEWLRRSAEGGYSFGQFLYGAY